MDIDSLTNRVAALSLALADAQERAARAVSGLGASACAAIVTLGPYPGTTIGEVARIAGLTHSVAVRMVEQLVAAGLVARASGADRRTVTLSLTPAGERMRERILAARAEAVRAALDPLPPPALAGLAEVLDPMLCAITRGREQADHLCRLCDEAACGEDCPVEEAARRLAGETP